MSCFIIILNHDEQSFYETTRKILQKYKLKKWDLNEMCHLCKLFNTTKEKIENYILSAARVKPFGLRTSDG